MSKPGEKILFKDLLKRGIITSFFMGTYIAIIQNKAVLDYFLKTGTIVQILFITIFGGLLYSWGTNKLIKIINRKKGENKGEHLE